MFGMTVAAKEKNDLLGQPLSQCLCDYLSMNNKKDFIKAVQILAPNEPHIQKAAAGVKQESLPAAPGGMALEFVVAQQKVAATVFPCSSRFKSTSGRTSGAPRSASQESPMNLEYALKVKSAEYWLKLGQPLEAMIEIQDLPGRVQKDPWLLRIHLAAMAALREHIVQE